MRLVLARSGVFRYYTQGFRGVFLGWTSLLGIIEYQGWCVFIGRGMAGWCKKWLYLKSYFQNIPDRKPLLLEL
jgi:hypothetical protein